MITFIVLLLYLHNIYIYLHECTSTCFTNIIPWITSVIHTYLLIRSYCGYIHNILCMHVLYYCNVLISSYSYPIFPSSSLTLLLTTVLALSLNSSQLNLPPLRTSLGQRCFSFMGTSVWRSLPAYLRGVTDFKVFSTLCEQLFSY